MTSKYHADNFISNLDKKDKSKLSKAASMTGVQISFKNEAFDLYGQPLLGCISVYSENSSQNCSPMWATFNSL